MGESDDSHVEIPVWITSTVLSAAMASVGWALVDLKGTLKEESNRVSALTEAMIEVRVRSVRSEAQIERILGDLDKRRTKYEVGIGSLQKAASSITAAHAVLRARTDGQDATIRAVREQVVKLIQETSGMGADISAMRVAEDFWKTQFSISPNNPPLGNDRYLRDMQQVMSRQSSTMDTILREMQQR